MEDATGHCDEGDIVLFHTVGPMALMESDPSALGGRSERAEYEGPRFCRGRMNPMACADTWGLESHSAKEVTMVQWSRHALHRTWHL